MSRRIPYLLAGTAVAAALLAGTYLRTRTFAPDPGAPFTVTATGSLEQGGRPVAYFDEHDALTLPLITPSSGTDDAYLDLTVSLAPGLDAHAITARLISIQSTEDVASYADGNAIYLSGGPFVPDSHTALRLEASPGTFAYPWDRQALHVLAILPFWAGAAFGLALAAVTAFLTWHSLPRRQRRLAATDVAGVPEPPSGIRPLELAVLRHGGLTATDLTALLLDLARRDYLRAVRRDGELLFARTSLNDGLLDYERGLLAVLFPNREQVSHLRDVVNNLNKELFSSVVNQLYVDSYRRLEAAGCFKADPRGLHVAYKTAAILMQAAGLAAAMAASFHFHGRFSWILPAGAGLYLSGWLLFRSAPRLSRFSPIGTRLVEASSAFVAYLSAKAPVGSEGDQGALFYRYAPYALVAGRLDEWFQRFAGKPFYVPEWYADANEELYLPERFVGSVLATARQLSKAITAVKDPNVD